MDKTTITELLNSCNLNPESIVQTEYLISKSIQDSPYQIMGKIFDLFIVLFTDEIEKNSTNVTTANYKILLFGEAFKRIRIAILLAKTGYYFEAVAVLRTAYELNKGINAINKKIVSLERYFGQKDEDFLKNTEKDRSKAIEKYTKSISQIVDNYDDKNIPAEIKTSLRTFKSNMHYSVHKSYSGLMFYLEDYLSGNHEPFLPDDNISNYEMIANDLTFVIVMYLKNWKNSEFYKPNDKNTIERLIQFEEEIYLKMPNKFHHDIMEYIKVKYS